MRLTGKLLVWWLVNALHHEQGVAMGHEQITPAATHKQVISLPLCGALVQLRRINERGVLSICIQLLYEQPQDNPMLLRCIVNSCKTDNNI